MQSETLTSVTDQVPKVLGPKGHAIMDYLAAGSLAAMGFALRRRHPQASTLAFINSGAVLGLSMLTDYPGGVFRLLSFRAHGVVDAIQATMLAAGPSMMGFGDDPEAAFFRGQAALEAGVVALTNWDADAARA